MGHDALTADVVIAADAGAGAGLGHLSRSGALVAALRARGWTVDAVALGVVEPIRHDVDWSPVPSLDLCPAPRGRGALVVDTYDVATPLRPLARGASLVVLNDRAAGASDADLVVSVVARPADGVLAGPRYACLRPAFWGVEPPAPPGRVSSVLVTAGATAAPAALAAIVAASLPEATVRVVVGPYASAETAPGVSRIEAPESMLPLLLESDVVVTAAGQTLLEALACGRPVVALVTAENQTAQATLVADAGAAVLAESPDAAAAHVAALAADPDRLAPLSTAAAQLVDGLGALRVAYAVERLLEGSA